MKDSLRAMLLAGVILGLAGPAIAASGAGSGPISGANADDILTQTPYDPVEEYTKGVTALREQRWQDAKRALSRVTSITPRNAEAWRLLGMANAGQNDLKSAKRAYERAVKIDPENINGHYGLGMALAGLKDAKAKVELDWLKSKAQACGGTCADAETLKTAVPRVEAAIAGTPSAALDAGSMLFSSRMDGAQAYVAAISLVNEHRYDEALASLAKAREVYGPHPDLLTYQGYTWRKKGDYAQAESYYRQALAVAPDHVGATEYYGELKVERGDLKGARAMLAKLERVCAYGCVEAQELRRWIDAGGEPQS